MANQFGGTPVSQVTNQFGGTPVQPVIPEGGALEAVVEPIRTIAGAAAAQIPAGIAGLAQTINPFAEEGAGERAVQDVQGVVTQPQTVAGQESLAAISELAQRGVDLANIPISGIAAIAELVTGQGLDKAAQTIKSIQGEGLGQRIQERAIEEGVSPEVAVVAGALPSGIEAAIGGRGVQAAAKAAPVLDIPKIAGTAFKQSPTKQRIAQLIEEGSEDVETAKFKLTDPATRKPQITRLEKALNVGGPRVQKDPVAIEAIKQGFDEGVVAVVKGSSKADKAALIKMVDAMQKGKKDARSAALNRPSDVAGDTLLQRFKVIRNANKRAGIQIDKVSKTLADKPVNIESAVNQFGERLDDLGVRLIDDGKGGFKPDFELSQLSPGDRGPIKEVVRQMNIQGKRGPIDGLTAHKMKRIIDNNVTFGKSKTGISRDAESALKDFRRSIDESLDNTFPAYDKANSAYAETIGALDSFQDVAGRKMDLSGGNADKAVGTLLRRTIGNAQSRVNLLDSVDEIEAVARKHGGADLLKLEGPSLGKNDLLTQILFVDELDNVFGPVARTSFQGQIDQAVQRAGRAATGQAGLVSETIGVAGKAAEKLRGINQQNAFKSIKELLKEER